jgi:hypothetical protein
MLINLGIFKRGIAARSDYKIRGQDSEMYAYLTRGHLGLTPERKPRLFYAPIYREIVKRQQKRRLQGVIFYPLRHFQTHNDTASGYFTLFSGIRSKRPRAALSFGYIFKGHQGI